MDDTHRRQLLFGTTPHRRSSVAVTGSQQQQPYSTSNNNNNNSHNSHSNAPPSSGVAAATEREMIEHANDERVDHLRGHVGEMRHLAINIGDEVRDQNAMLDGMRDNFDNADDRIRNTITQIRRLASSSGGFHLCMLLLFAFAFFALIYLLIQ